MQFSRILTYPKKAQSTKIIGLAIRTLILLVGVHYLFLSAGQQKSYLTQIGSYQFNWSVAGLLELGLVILLMPLNWLLEAKKWQILAKKTHLNIFRALKGVILGVSLGTFMPLGTGAVAGRVLTVGGESRTTYIPGVVLAQWLQTIVTLAFGSIGIAMVIAKEGSGVFNLDKTKWLIILLVLVLAVVLWYYIRHQAVNFRKYYQSILQYSRLDWFSITFFSVGRYLIFLLQFALLVTVFSPEIPVRLVIGCATWMFVARTVVPRLSNFETLGIRGAAAMYFCILFNLNFPGVLLAIVVLWFVNLFLPSLAGFFFLKEAQWDADKPFVL